MPDDCECQHSRATGQRWHQPPPHVPTNLFNLVHTSNWHPLHKYKHPMIYISQSTFPMYTDDEPYTCVEGAIGGTSRDFSPKVPKLKWPTGYFWIKAAQLQISVLEIFLYNIIICLLELCSDADVFKVSEQWWLCPVHRGTGQSNTVTSPIARSRPVWAEFNLINRLLVKKSVKKRRLCLTRVASVYL